MSSNQVPGRPPPRAKLLVSLHDVSPLTLDACREAIEVVRAAGVPDAALTVLVVPYHEQAVCLADHPPTLAFLDTLQGAGATLVAHGYTHRMTGSPGTPWRWLATRLFARNQGELAVCDAVEAKRRLDAADAIFARAGLATFGLVPPAWLLSRDAARVVAARQLAFVERMSGIFVGADGAPRARRLVGWGSLTRIEALATSAYAWLQTRRRPVDTRLAIHPPDVQRARTRHSLERTLRRLVGRLEPISYGDYLGAARAQSEPAPALSARS